MDKSKKCPCSENDYFAFNIKWYKKQLWKKSFCIHLNDSTVYFISELWIQASLRMLVFAYVHGMKYGDE